jgi:hypothetical protein
MLDESTANFFETLGFGRIHENEEIIHEIAIDLNSQIHYRHLGKSILGETS